MSVFSWRGKDRVEVQVASGIGLFAIERARQVEREGWTAEHDDEAIGGELVHAAICYAVSADDIANNPTEERRHVPDAWPWAPKFWKPASRLRMIVKAGALLAAEADRLMRLGYEQ